MAKINILTSEVYNLISAGEVVESPKGIVKELVENSIDAQATKIRVEVAQGGISKICVEDDGVGIEKSEIEKVFLPHATSKIATKEDIYKISTLGFRGEALSSISLVSNVVLISKPKEQEYGERIELEGNKIVDRTTVPAKDGTHICITKLFYNTPARYRFLNKPLQEQKEIYKVMCDFILSHPNIEFLFIADGEVKLKSNKGCLQTSINAVYGDEFASNLIVVNEKYKKWRLEGAISLPFIAKSNHSWQTTFVNNRCVQTDVLSSAVNGAYVDFLMKGKFPCFVLNLSVPYDEVDVNISPQKTEVKFKDSDKIFDWVFSVVKDILADISSNEEDMDREQNSAMERYNMQDMGQVQDDFQDNANQMVEVKNYASCGVSVGALFADREKYMDKLLNKDSEIVQVELIPNNMNAIKINEFQSIYEEKTDGVMSNSEIMNKVNMMTENDQFVSRSYEQASFLKKPNKVIGVLFSTYIIVEQGESFYIIDQHAAHERFLFDKFMKEIERGEVACQSLLVPYKLSVSLEEKEFILTHKETLLNLGVDLQEFGANSIIINQMPALLSDVDIEQFFAEILKDLRSFSRDKVLLRHKIATVACKSAIKAGDVLSQEEIDGLLEKVRNSESPLLCPHGRPYVVNFNKTEVEKWFRRIL